MKSILINFILLLKTKLVNLKKNPNYFLESLVTLQAVNYSSHAASRHGSRSMLRLPLSLGGEREARAVDKAR